MLGEILGEYKPSSLQFTSMVKLEEISLEKKINRASLRHKFSYRYSRAGVIKVFLSSLL